MSVNKIKSVFTRNTPTGSPTADDDVGTDSVSNDNKKDFLAQYGDKDELNKALNDSNSEQLHSALKNHLLSSDHIDKLLKSPEIHHRCNAFSVNPNANINSTHIDIALKDKNNDVRFNAAKHESCSAQNLHKALQDKDVNVRRAAISNPKATHEHFSKGLKDKNTDIRRIAQDKLDGLK